MIHRDGFYKGQEVEFQDYRRCWTRGTVMEVEPAHQKIVGPGEQIVTIDAGKVHVLYSAMGKRRVAVLNPKRVRGIE